MRLMWKPAGSLKFLFEVVTLSILFCCLWFVMVTVAELDFYKVVETPVVSRGTDSQTAVDRNLSKYSKNQDLKPDIHRSSAYHQTKGTPRKTVNKTTCATPNPKAAVPNTTAANSSLNKEDKQILSEQKIVIIQAYYRSGSTLTGSIFNEYPGNFYLFEPIRSIHLLFGQMANDSYLELTYAHGKTQTYKSSDRKTVIMNEINSWLTCSLDAISWDSLTDDFHRDFTTSMRQFFYCWSNGKSRLNTQKKLELAIKAQQENRTRQQMTQWPKNLNYCLQRAVTSCKQASSIVIKFIRLTMAEIAEIMPHYPNMKIIHLVRDPRGVSNSWRRLGSLPSNSYKEMLKNFCDSVHENLKYSKYILRKYPNRIKFVRYEDLAEWPEDTAKDMLDFAELKLTDKLRSFLRQQTSSEKDSCASCTERKSSNATANTWRQELPYIYADVIFSSCKNVTDILGYLPFASNVTQHDLRLPSRAKVDLIKTLKDGKWF